MMTCRLIWCTIQVDSNSKWQSSEGTLPLPTAIRLRVRRQSSRIVANASLTHPKHDGLDFDVKVRRVALFLGKQLDRLLQVERERVQPEQREGVQMDLHWVDVGEKFGRRH